MQDRGGLILQTPGMVAPAAADAIEAKAAQALIRKNHCTVCHAVDKKPRGPSFADIAKKQAAKVD